MHHHRDSGHDASDASATQPHDVEARRPVVQARFEGGNAPDRTKRHRAKGSRDGDALAHAALGDGRRSQLLGLREQGGSLELDGSRAPTSDALTEPCGPAHRGRDWFSHDPRVAAIADRAG